MARFFTTREIAKLLDVSVGSIANWIDQRKLKAGKTPGGHRRVVVADLIHFLRQQNLPIPAELEPPPTRILVVDDEEAVRHWLIATIRKAHPDYEVLEAGDGFTAGQLVSSRRPDVVVLDLTIPGMDGFEVCKRIKADETTASTEIIAITADPSTVREKQIKKFGARSCLAKPLVADDLLREIESALSS
jgi:excisionase family DNA binding protein